MKNENIDSLLKRALRCTYTPDAELVKKVKNDVKERPIVKKTKYSFSTAAAIVLACIVLATAAFAAWKLLNPGEVAEQFENHTLSAAFDSDTAININESVTSGGYIFTLLAVVTGEDITDMPYYSEDVQDERTYAVVAIQRADGTPMPATQDDEYGQEPFFASPLVRGQNPAQVNAVTMNGGYSETVVDGAMYRIVTCDGVSMFADRGLYFGICTERFINRDTFAFDEETGEISVNPDYKGASAIFDLPLDPSLADPEKAEQYLNDLFAPSDEAESGDTSDAPGLWGSVDWDAAVPVESTVKELTVDEDGLIHYSWESEGYGGGTISRIYEQCFTDEPTAQSDVGDYMGSEGSDGITIYAVRLTKDADGTIKGMIVVPEEMPEISAWEPME